MPSITINEELNHEIIVSDLKYYVKYFDEESLINMEMFFFNNTHYSTEFEYIIPFISPHKLVSLSVLYKNQKKIAHIQSTESFPRVKFDDEVACGNFAICLTQKDEVTSILTLSNFKPSSSAKISVKILSQVFDRFDNFSYFKIESIEKYNEKLYPNYSILFQNFSEKYSFQNIQFEYNYQNHTNDIYDKTKIEASNVSFQEPLIIKLQNKTTKHDIVKSLNSPKDIVLFVDYNAIKNKKVASQIIKFLQNYGEDFSFNIILFGQCSNILFDNMYKKSSKTISQAEEFLKNAKPTNLFLNFAEIYCEVFGLNCHNKVPNINNNIYNTIAICVGSQISDEIIISKKVPTYLIDPIQTFNTHAFAIQNNLNYTEPITHGKDDLELAFNNLLRSIQISSPKISNDDQNFYDQVDQIYAKKSLNDFKNYLDSNNLRQNLNLDKLSYLIENSAENLKFEKDDFIQFFEKVNLKSSFNDLEKMMNENSQLFEMIKKLIIFHKIFGKIFNKIFDVSKFSMKFFESIEKEPFISFEEDINIDNKDKYISSHLIQKNKIKQKQFKEYPTKKKFVSQMYSTTYYRDPQFYNDHNNEDDKKNNNKKLKKDKKLKQDNNVIKFKSLSESKKPVVFSNIVTENDANWLDLLAATKIDIDEDDIIQEELMKTLEFDEFKPQLNLEYAKSNFHIRFG